MLEQIEASCRVGGILIAHVCDCHLLQDRPIDTDDPKHQEDLDSCPDPKKMPERLKHVVSELNTTQPRPRLVIFGGDMTQRGRPREWEQFFRIVRTLQIPYLLTLGNHDHYERMPQWPLGREALCRELRSAKMCRTPVEAVTSTGLFYTAWEGPWRLLFVDSLFDQPLDAIQRRWLNHELSHRHAPTILSIHRPFVKVGNFLDRYRMRDPDLLNTVIASGCVVAVLSGHTHKRSVWAHAGITHLVSSSIYQGQGDTAGYRLVCLQDDALALTATRPLSGTTLDTPARYQLEEAKPYGQDLLHDHE